MAIGLAAKSSQYECFLITNPGYEFEDTFGNIAWILSLLTNLWATSLIGWKAW